MLSVSLHSHPQAEEEEEAKKKVIFKVTTI
jgi:hypothetical protein